MVIKGKFSKLDKADNPLDAIKAIFGENLDPNRPFLGQQHTYTGERGKQVLHTVRMRDVHDLVLKHIAHACGDDRDPDEIILDDLYKYDLNQIDPLGLVIELCSDIERMMGIYPNVPDLKKN